jgi:hypothetical protein
MKAIIKLSTLFLVFVMFFNGTEMASFEGKIFFKSYTEGKKDEVYVYYVKGDKVRIDQVANGVINGTILADTKSKEMFGLTPKHKIYYKKSYVPTDYAKRDDVVATKTGKTQNIKGFECTEYTVEDKANDSFITYYVSERNFDFFRSMLTTLNRKERLSVNYMQIDNLHRDFPFVGVEKKADGSAKQRLEVTLIEEAEVPAEMFDIPFNFVEQSY